MRYLQDREQGRVQTVKAYQALYPGYEEIIAREYEDLEDADQGSTIGRTSTLGIDESWTDLASPDDVIGPYHIVSVLGEGGMGTVFLAE